jgi:hypothetical protein
VEAKVEPVQRLRAYTTTAATTSQRMPIDLVLDQAKFTLLIDRFMTANMATEVAIRLNCPPPLQNNIAATRKKFANHRLFIGPRRTTPSQITSESYILLKKDDPVWQGAAAPEYALWFITMDEERLTQCVPFLHTLLSVLNDDSDPHS